MEDKEILRRILQGFKLIPAKFPLTYTTIAGKATPDLAKRVNAWIQTNFPNSLIRVAYDATHGILKFYRRMQEPISESLTKKVVKLILELFEARTQSATRRVRDEIVKADPRLRAASTTNRIFSDMSSTEFKSLLDSMGYLEIQELPAGDGDSSKFSTFVFREKKGNKDGEEDSENEKKDDKDLIRIVLATGVIAGDKGEKEQLANIQSIINGKKIKLIVGNKQPVKVDGFRQIGGNRKADFAFTDGSKDVVFIQHKSPTHQQISGIKKFMTKEGTSDYPEITNLLAKVKKEIATNGKLTGVVSEPITSSELRTLAVYGTTDPPSFSEDAVQVYCVGDLELIKVGSNTYKLSAKTSFYTFDTIPSGGDEPVLAATYRSGRNQAGLQNVRLGVYPKSYVERKSSTL